MAACAPASTAADMASAATTVFPLPTSPCRQPQHPARREHVGFNLGERLLLRPGEGIGERAAHPLCEISIASKRPPRKLPVAAPDERDGELRREHLIEGEPLPRLRPQRKVRRRLWTMQDVQRTPEGRPAFRVQKGSLLPLRKVRRLGQGVGHDAVQEFLREAERQGIDRLYPRKFRALGWSEDIIGMGHLKARAVALDATRHDPQLIERQETPHCVPVAVEEHEVERRAFVLANDAQRRTGRAFRRRVVTNRLDDERRHGSRRRLHNRRRQPPVEIAVREMPKKIDDPRRTQRLRKNLGQQLFASGAKTFHAGQRGAKRADVVTLGRDLRCDICFWRSHSSRR